MLKALEFLISAKYNIPCECLELDEVIKELEELENRSCNNCILGNQCTIQKEWERSCSFISQYVSPFCCNNWQPKQ